MKVKLHFTLVGKTYHQMNKSNTNLEWTNKDSFETVKETVTSHFGDRALAISNASLLQNEGINYPDYYCAGWFISSDKTSELVALAHGNTMDEASKSMMDFVKTLDWKEDSVRIQNV
jgi:hypothetical protein